MTKPNIIIPANLKTAVDIINNQIREYEAAKVQDCSVEYEVLKGNAISFGLEVLSAVTGIPYVWSRRKMGNGKLYSGVIRLSESNDDENGVYDNCAVVLKGGAANG